MDMPELPEVQNTVNGINESVLGRTITDVWSDYDSPFYYGKKQIKDPEYFKYFKKYVIGSQIIKARRRAKQILITLDSGFVIYVHMKMTGHFLYGQWIWNNVKSKWEPEVGFWNKSWGISKEDVKKTMPFSDPFNDFIHVLFKLDNGMQLAFSDMRKFGTLTLLETQSEIIKAQEQYGPEPLNPLMSYQEIFKVLRNKPNKKIKTALLDQSLIAGYGNIYTDEVLFICKIHPESKVSTIPEEKWKELYSEGSNLLTLAISHGGDSTGDYRKIDGTGGGFHNMDQVYQRENTPCLRCKSLIEKKQIDARVGRFCPNCQIMYSQLITSSPKPLPHL